MAKPELEAASRLAQGCRELGLGLDDAQLQRLMVYLGELERWNRSYNLTAVRDIEQMVVRHLLDALSVLPHLPEPRCLLDAGSGGGIPGVVLAIVRPQWPIVLLDSNGKKARFLRHAVRTLGLTQVSVVEARVEALANDGRADVIISRAFSSLTDFVTLTAGLLAADGRWYAMKGRLTDDECAALPDWAKVVERRPLQVPGLDEVRQLVVINRARPDQDCP